MPTPHATAAIARCCSDACGGPVRGVVPAGLRVEKSQSRGGRGSPPAGWGAEPGRDRGDVVIVGF
jgi:hypothetical protein